ncbi:MAG: MarR family transcriptional regulator [Actinobacteria bacterium]|nr:MarR family transcriptional regulator [Actinomycetota bacterium]MBW3651312.1 MarR family transcriptional regulator [Actinomycetota bacterium]
MSVDDHVPHHGAQEWTFLTNYAHVLLSVARQPDRRMRDIADEVGITERAAHRIVNELVAAGYLSKHRVGRRNSYEVHPEVPLRHPLERDHAVGELLELLLEEGRSGKRRGAGRR